MLRRYIAVGFGFLVMVACTSVVPEVAATEFISATKTPTLTQTITLSPTATTTSTTTPIPPLNLEDWKGVLSGISTIGRFDGIEYVSDSLFDPNGDYRVLKDPEAVLDLRHGTQTLILNPTGQIIIFSSQEVAAERVRNGAVVIMGNPNYELANSITHATT